MKVLAVIKKELTEHVRNFKLPLLVMIIFGAILMALYTEVGPTAKSSSVLDPFLELFLVICPIIGIAAAMDSIVGEKERGTLELVLSKPISRGSLLYGKFATYILIIVPLLAAELILAYYWAQVSGISTLRWQLPMPPLSQWLSMVVILSLVCMYYTALTILISLFAPSTTTAGLVGVLFMTPAHPLGGHVLQVFLRITGWNDFGSAALPFKFVFSVFGKYQKFAVTSTTDFLIGSFSLLILTVFLLFVSGWIFEKQNIAYRI